jgi:hypothetical protein
LFYCIFTSAGSLATFAENALVHPGEAMKTLPRFDREGYDERRTNGANYYRNLTAVP